MKAYILRHESELSHQYADHTAKSCDAVGIQWEYVEGYNSDVFSHEAVNSLGILNKPYINQAELKRGKTHRSSIAGLCSAGHVKMWKKLVDSNDDAAIILEHDALMLHQIDLKLPENTIVCLGYKLEDPDKYNHVKAGPPNKIIEVKKHRGSHAYAITRGTAEFLINEIRDFGSMLGCIDQQYFSRNKSKTKSKLAIADPTPAIGWLRKSTIWTKSSTKNFTFIKSFQDNLR